MIDQRKLLTVAMQSSQA